MADFKRGVITKINIILVHIYIQISHFNFNDSHFNLIRHFVLKPENCSGRPPAIFMISAWQ